MNDQPKETMKYLPQRQRNVSTGLCGIDIERLDYVLDHYSTELVPTVSSLLRKLIRDEYFRLKKQEEISLN